MTRHSKHTINSVLFKRFTQGKSYTQIGEELGITYAAALGIAHRHRKQSEWGQPSKPKAYCQ